MEEALHEVQAICILDASGFLAWRLVGRSSKDNIFGKY
jgi:hypothetical protein